MAGRPIVRLIQDDGEWFFRGDRVRLHRTLSTPPEQHAVRDADGPYEVMRCSRLPLIGTRLLQLVLRETEPAWRSAWPRQHHQHGRDDRQHGEQPGPPASPPDGPGPYHGRDRVPRRS